MKRRALLGTVATLAVAGCTASDLADGGADTTRTTQPTESPTRSTTRLADGVESTQFSWTRSVSARSKVDDPPAVSFPGSNRVTVEGVIHYGSSACDRIALREVTYEDGALEVAVEAAPKADQPKTCTDDIAAGVYTVDVSLTGGLPARVVVTEHAYEETKRHTATPP